MPFGDLQAFVEHARRSGVAPDHSVTGIGADQDPTILIALRVELDELDDHPADVHVNRADILELLDVFAEIDENDGDGRAQLATIRDLR